MIPIQQYREKLAAWLIWIPLIMCGGCSSEEFGTVTGTVTADGKPVPNARVTFYPRPDGRASSGKTDENGSYELIYTRSKEGAEVGNHLVKITTAVAEGDYGDKIARETLPAKYNIASELTREVAAGSNVIDFELDYAGEVVQTAY